MNTPRVMLPLIALVALSAAPGCEYVDEARDRFGTTDTLSVGGSGSGLVLGLHAPGMVRQGDQGVIRLSVTNRTDTAVAHIRLELIVPGWAVPMPPRPGEPEVRMVALVDGSTRFAYSMEDSPIESGQTQVIEQRIHVPAADTSGPGVSASRIVRGRLLDGDGEALAEVEGAIGLEGAGPSTAATTSMDGEARDRIGPLRLGMSAAALRQAAESVQDTTWTQEGATNQGVWATLSGDRRTLAVMSDGSVSRLEVRDPAVRTREGLGIGSSLRELRSAYGQGCADVADGGVVVWFTGAPGISFALKVATPDDVAQLRANPDRLPGTASVTRWWIHWGASCQR